MELYRQERVRGPSAEGPASHPAPPSLALLNAIWIVLNFWFSVLAIFRPYRNVVSYSLSPGPPIRKTTAPLAPLQPPVAAQFTLTSAVPPLAGSGAGWGGTSGHPLT